jgi:hypothetical protein
MSRRKVLTYQAFVETKLEVTKHLAGTVHDLYLEPKYEESRTTVKPVERWMCFALTSNPEELATTLMGPN